MLTYNETQQNQLLHEILRMRKKSKKTKLIC